MKQFVNVGTNSFVNVEEIESISPPESAPIKQIFASYSSFLLQKYRILLI